MPRLGMNFLRIAIACLLYSWLLTFHASADLLLNVDPKTPNKYSTLVELLGYQEDKGTAKAPQIPNELQQVLEDLNAADWPKKKRALVKVGLNRSLREWQTLKKLFTGRTFHSYVVAANFDGDAAIEYLLLLDYFSGDAAPYLVYVDETLSKRPPILYKSAKMYDWFMLVRDVNGDAKQDFILYAHQKIGTGMGYKFVLIFNVHDGKLKPLVRITFRCHYGMTGSEPAWELEDKFELHLLTSGNLRRFGVRRNIHNWLHLLGNPLPGIWQWGGWNIRIEERLKYEWEPTAQQYNVKRTNLAIRSDKDPRSQSPMPFPSEVYKEVKETCAERGERTYRRVP